MNFNLHLVLHEKGAILPSEVSLIAFRTICPFIANNDISCEIGENRMDYETSEVVMPEYVEVALRATLSFIVLFTLARILGKKQISQLTFFDYVVGIVIGDMASTLAIDTKLKITSGLTGLVVYTLFSVILAYGAIKSFKFRDLVESSPSILVKNGKIMEKNLLIHKMTYDDLLTGLRGKGAFNLDEVEMAILETNGQISVMKKPEFQSLTANDIDLTVEEDHAPSLIIIDGVLLPKRLHYLGYTEEWLLSEIKQQGATKFE
ncbi:DUF421 domain-containing protein, partial [Neobacillus vireti]